MMDRSIDLQKCWMVHRNYYCQSMAGHRGPWKVLHWSTIRGHHMGNPMAHMTPACRRSMARLVPVMRGMAIEHLSKRSMFQQWRMMETQAILVIRAPVVKASTVMIAAAGGESFSSSVDGGVVWEDSFSELLGMQSGGRRHEEEESVDQFLHIT